MRLECGGERAGLGRDADVGAGLAHRGQARAQWDLAGDEVGPPRRAARLGVVVGEQHALRGQLVEVRRLARHHAAMIGADVEPADVVAHDEDDVRLLAELLRALFLPGVRQEGNRAQPVRAATGALRPFRRTGLSRRGRDGCLERRDLARRRSVAEHHAGREHEQHMQFRILQHLSTPGNYRSRAEPPMARLIHISDPVLFPRIRFHSPRIETGRRYGQNGAHLRKGWGGGTVRDSLDAWRRVTIAGNRLSRPFRGQGDQVIM